MPTLEDGYKIISEFLSHDQLLAITREIESAIFPDKSGGIRNAEKKFPAINALAGSEQLTIHAKQYLSGIPRLVRAILFNKTLTNNWLVTWHQDRTVAISRRFEKEGWGPWSVKEGIVHVQPPLAVLNNMVTFRIHLDDTSKENGCLKLLPKSHTLGILDHAAIQEYVKNHKPINCEAPAGSALIMRPHILHSSSKATNPSQRRVLHLEYSGVELPLGVEWA